MNANAQLRDFHDDRGALIVPLVCGVLGTSGFQLAPFLLAALVDLPGWTAADAAIPLSIEFIAAGFASLTVPRLLRHITLRDVTLVSMVLFCAGSAAGCLCHNLIGLVLIRGLVGMGEGLAMSAANIGISRRSDRARGFSVLMVGILLFGFVGLVAAPLVIARFHLNGILLALATAGLSAITLALRAPRPALKFQRTIPEMSGRADREPPLVRWVAVLVAYFALFAAQGALWAYIDRIGLADGLIAGRIGAILAASTLTGAIGAGLSARLSSRALNAQGIRWAVLASGALLPVFLRPLTQAQFAIAICALQFLWCFASPSFLAALARAPVPARAMAGSVFSQLAGLGAGPLFASMVMVDKNGTTVPVRTAFGLSITALLIVYYGLRVETARTNSK